MRIPLYVKITGWFLLNLVLVFLGFWLFIRVYFPGTLDAVLMGPAATRIDSVTQLVLTELKTSGPEEWTPSLKRIGEAYAVQLFSCHRGPLASQSGRRSSPRRTGSHPAPRSSSGPTRIGIEKSASATKQRGK